MLQIAAECGFGARLDVIRQFIVGAGIRGKQVVEGVVERSFVLVLQQPVDGCRELRFPEPVLGAAPDSAIPTARRERFSASRDRPLRRANRLRFMNCPVESSELRYESIARLTSGL